MYNRKSAKLFMLLEARVLVPRGGRSKRKWCDCNTRETFGVLVVKSRNHHFVQLVKTEFYNNL